MNRNPTNSPSDLGGNIGVQVRKLFEPSLYPGATFVNYVRTNLTSDIEAVRKYACAVTVEANPAHTVRLRELERCYRDINGWRTHVLMPRAVGAVDDESLKLFLEDDASDKFWSASTVMRKPGAKPRIIKTIDIAKFIQDEVCVLLVLYWSDVLSD